MGKVGYISFNASDLKVKMLSENTDYIVFSGQKETKQNSFLNFLKGNISDIVIYDLTSIGEEISLNKLKEPLDYIIDNNISIDIIDKGAGSSLTNREYIVLFLEIVEQDIQVRSKKTKYGIEQAKLKGRIGGRPRISQEDIEQIKKLYKNHKKTYREISEILGISLGTAYKYSKEIENK